jgi:hypothetical protein
MNAQALSNPTALLASLTREEVRARLNTVEAERAALLTLLRSINARERRYRRIAQTTRQGGGDPHAA